MDSTELDVEPRGDADDGQGAGRGPGSPMIKPVIWVVVALVCLVGGFFVLSRGGPATSSGLPAPAVSSPRPALPVLASPGPNQRQYLSVARICGAITNGRSRLAISFEVQNVSQYDVTISSVRSVLPLGLLRPTRFTAGGDCVAPGTLPVTGPIRSQRSQYFTLNFALPKTCPASAAVLVRINFEALGFHETSLSILESDLAIPNFVTCPKTPKAAQGQRTGPPKPVT